MVAVLPDQVPSVQRGQVSGVLGVSQPVATRPRISGYFNIAGALPFSLAPAIAPAILVIGGGSYGVLYMVAGFCAILGAFAILPVRRVR